MEIEDINILAIKAIENDFNEKIISQIVFLYFKNDKKIIDCYEKIRIGISEEIFNLFMNIANNFNELSKGYDEGIGYWWFDLFSAMHLGKPPSSFTNPLSKGSQHSY